MKRILAVAFAILSITLCYAQGATNSPYSQYALGTLSYEVSGFNAGMNGVGLGFNDGNQINYSNPASYASLDSLTFIFDAGVAAQITNFRQGNRKLNAKNANFEYIVSGFRAAKHLGVSFGLVPFSNIKYDYFKTGDVDLLGSVKYTNRYVGSGGLHRAYLGLGWEPFRNVRIGTNISYLWGEINRIVSNSYNDLNINTLSKTYTADIQNYKLDFGAQYEFYLSKKNKISFGFVYGIGHSLNANPQCMITSINSQTLIADTTRMKIADGLRLPTSYGVGCLYVYDEKIKLGFDYKLQKWGTLKYPFYSSSVKGGSYTLSEGLFNDRHKFILGGEYYNGKDRRFLQKIRYRAGFSYIPTYLKINGHSGPKELSASLGFGIPIINGYNGRSFLNISAQWVKLYSKEFITENSFRVTIGLTFNEKWFAKWKVD